MNRRCTVLGTDASGQLILSTADYGVGTAPVPRPMVGSSTTGFHSTPPTGAQVLVLHDGEHMTPIPAAAVSASDSLGALATQAAGESFILGPRGDVLSYATATGPIVLYRNAANTLALTIDPATNRINLTCSGGLFVNGTQVTVP